MLNNLIYNLITKRGEDKKVSDYQYSALEHTPLLHDTDTLNRMYDNAVTEDQKAAIMLHIDNHHKVTNDWDEYVELRNKIWDDFS